MTNKETVNNNIGLTFDLIKEIVKEPELSKNIEDQNEIEFVQKDTIIMEKNHNVKNKKFVKVVRNFKFL